MPSSCPDCGTRSPTGARFCQECGHALARSCPQCGAVAAGGRFCADCGAALDSVSTPTGPSPVAMAAPVTPAAPANSLLAERRLTSVLFGDLVGFGALGGGLEPEDARELLSRYFQVARTIVARYGGTVEKFIGDAVMAVWGVPATHEDDAERAVRAGLDLVTAVRALAEEVPGEHGLAMRVGVVTGEVAVSIGATRESANGGGWVGERMVAGDAVNTAARVQAIAPAGAVWVDESTRSLTAAAVQYTDRGAHLLKGKTTPVTLFAAGRVVAGVGGVQRVDGLEAPFTGRDRELRLVKELFHACAEEGRPRLVAVSGAAGIGKSRLGWEFEKYIDGLRQSVWWHRGRCLSYGDGVAFHALAEMVRSRLDVVDGDSAEVVGQKLTAGLARHIPDASEREWLTPRVAALVGSTGAREFRREDLFPAWRVFFERVSAGKPLVLLVEDLQWADSGLLDFVEHVLDTSRAALFVLTLARPELEERRVGWATGRRATRLRVEPLADGPMGVLVDGLVAGLPEASRRVLVARSEGVPLYAVETVRALIDRDAVVASGGHYVLAPGAADRVDVATLGAPPSLQALLSARLDALPPAERQVLRDASVLGLVFTLDGLYALGYPPGDVEKLLDSLRDKEFLTIEVDPRSPERGNYRFVQTLVRTVAYETLSRRDRKSRHLKVARHLEKESLGDELAAILARHYLDARATVPDDPDCDDLADSARRWLARAADRAGRLGAPAEARRRSEEALGLARTDLDRAKHAAAAAGWSLVSGTPDAAERHAAQAHECFLAAGAPVEAAAVMAVRGDALSELGRCQEAVALLGPVLTELDPAATIARLPLELALARAYLWIGDLDAAGRHGETALGFAEAQQDLRAVSRGMGSLGAVMFSTGRPYTGLAMMDSAAELARLEQLPADEVMALNNAGVHRILVDLPAALTRLREGARIAREIGERQGGVLVTLNLLTALWLSGDWDEALAVLAAHEEAGRSTASIELAIDAVAAHITICRNQALPEPPAPPAGTENPIDLAFVHLRLAITAAARGEVTTWSAEGQTAFQMLHEASGVDDDFHLALPVSVEGAIAAGDLDRADAQLEVLRTAPTLHFQPYLAAQSLRLEALLIIARNAPGPADAQTQSLVEQLLGQAIEDLGAFGAPFWQARVRAELARWWARHGRVDEAATQAALAVERFEALGAERYLPPVRELIAGSDLAS